MELLKFSRYLAEKKKTTIRNVYAGLHPLDGPKRTSTRLKEGLIDKAVDTVYSTIHALRIKSRLGKLHRRLSKHYSGYDDHEKHYIKHYTEDFSADINKRLHYGQQLEENHHYFKKGLDSATNRHRTPEDLRVYTAAHFEPKGNERVHMKSYTSTSIDHTVAFGFAAAPARPKHVLSIHVPKGSRGAYVAHHSSWEEEHEFVLPRNSHLHIQPYPKNTIVKHPLHGEQRVKLWKAKLVHDGTESTGHTNQ